MAERGRSPRVEITGTGLPPLMSCTHQQQGSESLTGTVVSQGCCTWEAGTGTGEGQHAAAHVLRTPRWVRMLLTQSVGGPGALGVIGTQDDRP